MCVRERRKGNKREPDDEDHVVCYTVGGSLLPSCSCVVPAVLLHRPQDESRNLEQHNVRFVPRNTSLL